MQGSRVGPSLTNTMEPTESGNSANAPTRRAVDKDSFLDHVDLRETYKSCKRWRETSIGWYRLTWFLLFFALYAAVLLLQGGEPQNIFTLDEVLRNRVVDEKHSLQQITTHADFFQYLKTQILPTVFQNQWYNNESFKTSEAGYIMQYNKLVGGLLIVQERGMDTSPCLAPFYSGARSSYEVQPP
jgi:hypothetical protein